MKRKIDNRTDEEKRATQERMAKVRDGKLAKHQELEAAKDALEDNANESATETKPKEERRKRIPLGRQDVLSFPKRAGFHRRIFNDNDKGRIKAAKDAGYTIVKECDIDGGDTRAGADSQMASPVERSVGGGMKGILMEISQDWYDEDQKAKQDKISAEEKKKMLGPAITGVDKEGYYGDLKVNISR